MTDTAFSSRGRSISSKCSPVYFFVPRENVDHAKRVLSQRDPRLAERVFPLDVLEMLYAQELKREGRRRLLE